MANAKQLASGRHLSSCVLTLLSIGTDGTLTEGTTNLTDVFTLTSKSSYIGFLEDVEFDIEQNVDDGTVIGSPYDNDIPTTVRWTATLTEPLQYASAGNFLAKAFTNTVSNADSTTGTPYAKFAIARAGKTWTLYGLMRSYREMYRKNKLVGVMTLSVIDNTAGSTAGYA
jgi:hypothetical protein